MIARIDILLRFSKNLVSGTHNFTKCKNLWLNVFQCELFGEQKHELNLLYVIMSRTRFTVNLHSIAA